MALGVLFGPLLRMRTCGAVYAWGRGDLGQLGVGDESDHPNLTALSTLVGKDIVHIAAGDYHSAFLTGTILSFMRCT